MDKPIEVGCWAIIAKPAPCCGILFKGAPYPFLVTEVAKLEPADRCSNCGAQALREMAYGFWSDGAGVSVAVLKRIDDPEPDNYTIEEMSKDLERSSP